MNPKRFLRTTLDALCERLILDRVEFTITESIREVASLRKETGDKSLIKAQRLLIRAQQCYRAWSTSAPEESERIR